MYGAASKLLRGENDNLDLRLGMRLKRRRGALAAKGRGLREYFTEARTSAMEMGFGVADGPIEHGGDFRMFVALNIVEHDDEFLRRAELGDSALEVKTIQGRGKARIRGC